MSTKSIVIEGIFTCPVGSEQMVSKDTATLIEGVGMEGDRYANNIGTYSVLKEPGRQLTLISADSVETALNEEGKQLASIGSLRRNVVLRGISSSDLLQGIGSIVEFEGQTESPSSSSPPPQLFIHRNCVPCMYNERKNQIPGLMECLWETGGVSCEIIRGGTIRVGDTMKILSTYTTDDNNRIPTDGGKPDGFYIRPKLRTAAIVKAMLEGKNRTKERLMETDKEGLLRLQRGYESVGLKY